MHAPASRASQDQGKSANIAAEVKTASANDIGNPYNFMGSEASAGYSTELVTYTSDPFDFMRGCDDVTASTFSAEHDTTTPVNNGVERMGDDPAPAADTTRTPLVSATDSPATPTTAVDVPKLFAKFTGHRAAVPSKYLE